MKNIGQSFLDGSKHATMPTPDEKKGVATPLIETPVEGERIALTPIEDIAVPSLTLDEALKKRKSHRKFLDKIVDIDTFSYLLYMMQGVRKAGKNATLRMVPSAGARHAFEPYIAVRKVEGLTPGIYRYMAMEHALIKIEDGDVSSTMVDVCEGQPFVGTAAFNVVLVANTYRMIHRYGMRGYRYLFMDAGHVVENLYLCAPMFNLGTVAVGAYDDDAVNQWLNLDGSNRFVIYIAPVGYV